MKKILIKFSCAVVVVAIATVGVFSNPRKVDAVPTGLPFGGLATITLPCTCSFSLAIWFTPLWLGNAPVTGILVYQPASTFLYPGYLIGVPGAWHLGAYSPGVQACFIVTPVGCILIPSYGLIQYTGTSVPGPY